MIMNRIRIIGIFVLTLTVISPAAALADWKIYYTGTIGKHAGYGGRGSFATRSQCDAYRRTQSFGDQSMSYCSGFDTPQSRPSGDYGSAAREQEKQRQLQLQRAKKEKELELERQKKFDEEKDKLLGSLKGTNTGTLGMKTGTAPKSSCIKGDPLVKRACFLNGSPCCPPYRCEGKFPSTYCVLEGTSTDELELKKPSNKGRRDSVSIDPKVLKEQDEFEKNPSAYVENQKKLNQQRLEKPNEWCRALSTSLKTKAPPLPYKKFDELQAGDVLLIEGENKLISGPDQVLSGHKASIASHTVIYLKEINGKKIFMDDQPNEGSRIVPEDYILNKYGHRGVEVAKLAQPLRPDEAEQLYKDAREMRSKNLKKIEANKWFDKTTYGAWGKDNLVCSEADWALIKAAGREIPQSDDRIKKGLGINFSPADFLNNEQYFLVSPMAWPKR